MIKLPPILPAPCSPPPTLATSAKWLAGEGAGSWFLIEKAANSTHKISRFSPDGTLECEGLFSSNLAIDLQKEYLISYPSHCAIVTIKQDERLISFEVITQKEQELAEQAI